MKINRLVPLAGRRWKDVVLFLPVLVLLGTGATRARETPEFLERTATIDGFKIHYRMGGSGPYLLMLHGMTLTSEHWLPFAGDLMNSYTVVVADLPGHGGSSPLPGIFSFEKSAELMLGLLDELGVQQAYGIGHSAGGMTLLHMAARQPKRLKAMVLVDAPHYLGPEAREIVREDTWDRLDPAVQEWYRKLHPGGQQQAEKIYRQYNGLADNSESVAPEVLKTLPINVLIVWGDRDPAFPLEIPMEMYRSLPNAALWVIPQQGHTPLWVDMGGDASAAAAFGKVVKDFLAQEKVSGGKWF